MNLGRFAVTRPVAVTMRIAALVLLGYVCLLRLPIDLLPRVDVPTVVVNVSWPNTGPEEMEAQITRPLEQALSATKGLDRINSTSSLGNSSVRIQFKYGVDVDKATVDVLQQAQRAVGRFPRDPNISSPSIFKFDPSQLPILVYGVTSTKDDLIALRSRLINEISPQLEAAGGIAQVNISGGQDRSIMVDLDVDKVRAHGLRLADVANRISQENVSLPAGLSQQGKTQYNLRSVGQIKNLRELVNLPVSTTDQGQVTIGELGEVRDASPDVTFYTRFKGVPALNLSITKQSDANTVQTSAAVEKLLKDIAERNPDLKFGLVYDQAKFIENSIADLQETAVIGGILAILIITFFLRNLKSTLVVALSIPISIVSTFSLLYFCGFTLNSISLSGLALATGLIVDDAIVVLENIYRHLEREKLTAHEAAIKGTNEILSAVLASTFTVMIVFLPLFLVQGQPGQIFTQFGLVVIFSIAVSLLDAVSVVPMLASKMIQGHEELEKAGKLSQKVGSWLHGFDESYQRVLKFCLRHRVLVFGVGIVTVLIAAALWPLVGKENLPASDSGNITMRVKLPIGTPVDKTDSVMRQIEAVLAKDKEVESYVVGAGTNVGLRGGGGGAPQEGSALLRLREPRKSTTADVVKRLQKQFSGIPGAIVQIQAFDVVQNILGNNTGFAIDLYGQDLTQLTTVARQLRQALLGVQGLQNPDLNVQDALPEIQWEVDRARAQALGVSFTDVAGVISLATTGQLSTYYRENGFQYPIIVQVRQDQRMTPESVGRLPVANRSGQIITLDQVAKPVYGIGPNQVFRQDRQRVITVSGNMQGRPENEIQADVFKALASVELPPGIHWQLGAQQVQRDKDYSGLGVAVFLAIALIYILLAAQFESFIYPLVVLVSVPLASIGLVLALFLTDRAFGLTAFIGLLMLIGIVVKNGILLVDSINHLRSEGLEREEAILRAGPNRLRPILMTSLAAILGMLPLALGIGSGSEIYVPLATSVIGGLFTSTLLTLLIVPVVYTFFDDLAARLAKG